jgi:uncharacterized protein YdcH (DUF465 family)
MMHHGMSRFPEHADAIEALGQGDSSFRGLCHRYGKVVESLLGLEQGRPGESAGVSAEDLKQRRAAMEEEMLLAIDVNRP